MGPPALLPLRMKACWGFFSPWKILTASAGFEPTNLGTRGQHASSRPPKPLIKGFTLFICRLFVLEIKLLCSLCDYAVCLCVFSPHSVFKTSINESRYAYCATRAHSNALIFNSLGYKKESIDNSFRAWENLGCSAVAGIRRKWELCSKISCMSSPLCCHRT
jgi:hypothetical protein